MSYDVLAIAVDLDRVKAAVGSKDAQLHAQLVAEFPDDLAQIQSLQEELLDEDEGPYPAEDAMRDLIAGGPYRDDAALSYYFCFELFCRHFGDSMDNDAWLHLKSGWFDDVRDGLRQAGLKQKEASLLADIAFSGPPVDLPDAEEYPNLGYLTKGEVMRGRAMLTKADLSKVKDDEVRAAIGQLRSWLDECAESGRGLVCTYA